MQKLASTVSLSVGFRVEQMVAGRLLCLVWLPALMQAPCMEAVHECYFEWDGVFARGF